MERPASGSDFRRIHFRTGERHPQASGSSSNQGGFIDAGLFPRNRQLDGGRDLVAGSHSSRSLGWQTIAGQAGGALARNSFRGRRRLVHCWKSRRRSSQGLAFSRALERWRKMSSKRQTTAASRNCRTHHLLVPIPTAFIPALKYFLRGSFHAGHINVNMF